MEKRVLSQPLRKLGRKRYHYDRRTLYAARYMKAASPPPPAVDNMSKVPEWPIYENNRIADCTVAGAGHLIGLWTFGASGIEGLLLEQGVIAAYAAISGYDPITGANDNGAAMLDVLNYWRKVGIDMHKIFAFAQLDINDHDQLKQAVNLFGGIYTGVRLPVSAESQLNSRQIWDWVNSSDNAPGSWGDHAVAIGAYDQALLTCATWGNKQQLTWKFWDMYFEEAWAIVSEDFIFGGKSPQGFDLLTLQADLIAIRDKQSTTIVIPPTANGCAPFRRILKWLDL